MALIMETEPRKTRSDVLGRFLSALPDDDRAQVEEWLADKNYGPTELMRVFRLNGYEGTQKPIYDYRLKRGI